MTTNRNEGQLTDKMKEYIGDAIVHMALSLYFVNGENTFQKAISRIYKVQSNSHLADVARDFNIKPVEHISEGYKKYADAVEVHVYNLSIEHGLQFAIDWVIEYIAKRQVTIPKKFKKKQQEDEQNRRKKTVNNSQE
jgi:hypothetical protein